MTRMLITSVGLFLLGAALSGVAVYIGSPCREILGLVFVVGYVATVVLMPTRGYDRILEQIRRLPPR